MYDHVHHATCIGHEYIGNKVILHFLHEQMRKKEKSEEEEEEEEEEEDDDPNTLNSNSKSNNTVVRMFPKSLYSKVLKIWPLWPQQQPYFVISKNSGAYKGMGFHIPG
jgi:hypothetical protein